MSIKSMEDVEVQWKLIYVPCNNVEPHITVIVSMSEAKQIRDLKELILKTLQKESLVLSRIAIATVFENWIIQLPEDDVQLKNVASVFDFYRISLFAFEIKSPPSGYKCVECRRQCDNERKQHINKICKFFISDICMRNYFKKDPKFHLCPVCHEEVTASSFIKVKGLFSYVQLVNVPILLRHETINKHTGPNPKSLILFGYPRLLKLPIRVCATDLFELVKQVVPEGEYSLHKGQKQGFKCYNNHCTTVDCTGCKIPETGLVQVSDCAIHVHYTNIPKISPPILHSIAHFDTSQHISETENPSMQNLLVSKLNIVENKVPEETADSNINYPIPSKNTNLQKTFENDKDPKVDDSQVSYNNFLTVKGPKITVPVWPSVNITQDENSQVTENSKINIPDWMRDDFPELQKTINRDGDYEIGALNLPRETLTNSLNTRDTRIKIWKDYFGFQYEIDELNGKKSYKCTTGKVWSLCDNQDGEQPLKILNFDLFIGKSFQSIYVDVKGNAVDYQILGPITVAEQSGNQLTILTIPSFRSSHYFITGQILFVKTDDFFTPCGIITCSIPEEGEYRYVISNYKQQKVCLSCEDEIKEVPFGKNRPTAVKDEDYDDLDVCYWEQHVENEERILRYLNSYFEVVYTCWDSAKEEYDPMRRTSHWLEDTCV